MLYCEQIVVYFVQHYTVYFYPAFQLEPVTSFSWRLCLLFISFRVEALYYVRNWKYNPENIIKVIHHFILIRFQTQKPRDIAF